jgi:hypothetical protein
MLLCSKNIKKERVGIPDPVHAPGKPPRSYFQRKNVRRSLGAKKTPDAREKLT